MAWCAACQFVFYDIFYYHSVVDYVPHGTRRTVPTLQQQLSCYLRLICSLRSRLPPPPARAKPALLFSNIEEKERERRKHLGSVAKNTLFFARERARVQIDSLLKKLLVNGWGLSIMVR